MPITTFLTKSHMTLLLWYHDKTVMVQLEFSKQSKQYFHQIKRFIN